MTTATVSIPAAAITGLRLVCKHCGAQMVIPIPTRNTPERCFSCAAEMPGPALVPLLNELGWLHRTAGKAELSFEAAIEGHDERSR